MYREEHHAQNKNGIGSSIGTCQVPVPRHISKCSKLPLDHMKRQSRNSCKARGRNAQQHMIVRLLQGHSPKPGLFIVFKQGWLALPSFSSPQTKSDKGPVRSKWLLEILTLLGGTTGLLFSPSFSQAATSQCCLEATRIGEGWRKAGPSIPAIWS